jgi:sulfur carrier protein ThiS
LRIYIEVSDFLKRYLSGQKEVCLDLPKAATVSDAINAASIPEDEIGFIVLKDTKVENDYVLEDGDRIKIFNLIIGG